MKVFSSLVLVLSLTLLVGCGSSSMLVKVSATAPGSEAQTVYKSIASVFESNNFVVSGDETGFKGLIADYKTPWTYTIKGDGEDFHEKVFTLGMEFVVDITANPAGGFDIVLKPFYWQSEDLSDFDKKMNKIAERVNEKLKKDVLQKTDPAAAFPNTSLLRYYKEDDRESGALTPEDTKIYRKMIVVASKVLDDLSAQLNIGKDKLNIEIKE